MAFLVFDSQRLILNSQSSFNTYLRSKPTKILIINRKYIPKQHKIVSRAIESTLTISLSLTFAVAFSLFPFERIKLKNTQQAVFT